ncbi:MAG: EAL domain-containing protein [Nitrosomonadales bacterium]|nr:EAL domain-containing protein [Nitrosomonadales bacterium]
MEEEQIYIGRQPILDRQGNLVAFELLFRSGREKDAHVTDDVIATATVISNAFSSLGIDAVLGKHKGFLNLDAFLLKSDTIELLPRDRVVFELLETIHIDADIIERCKQLKSRGFTLALDDFLTFSEAFIPALEIVDIVKVDILPLSRAELKETVSQLKKWPVKLLAEKVDSPEQHQYCLDLGFDLFQGYHFAKPVIMSGKQLSPSELALMKLLSLLLADAETIELEKLIKSQPELIMKLMRLINSVGSGLTRKITSIHDAIIALGRNQLTRWLKLLLYSQTTHHGKSSEPLMQIASQRARLMELLAAYSDQNLQEEAFMVGILSLLGALFNMPLDELISTLGVDENVESALLCGEGELGKLLRLAELFERDNLPDIEKALTQLPWLSMEQACAAQQQAIIWTNQMVTGME